MLFRSPCVDINFNSSFLNLVNKITKKETGIKSLLVHLGIESCLQNSLFRPPSFPLSSKQSLTGRGRMLLAWLAIQNCRQQVLLPLSEPHSPSAFSSSIRFLCSYIPLCALRELAQGERETELLFEQEQRIRKLN